MTEVLALFPLALVAYPGESVNLHIFEQRYRDLLMDVETENSNFAIPTVIDGHLRPLATEVSLASVARRYPGGESDIRLVGRRIVRVHEFFEETEGKSYPGGLVSPVVYETREDPARNREIVELTRQIYMTLKIERDLPMDLSNFKTYHLAHYIGFTLEQEYEFLTLLAAEDRQTFMLDHLRNVRPDATRQVNMEARAKLNGHFRELQSPEF